MLIWLDLNVVYILLHAGIFGEINQLEIFFKPQNLISRYMCDVDISDLETYNISSPAW